MIAIRAAKVALVAAVALFALSLSERSGHQLAGKTR
jgi:hypothetical protein